MQEFQTYMPVPWAPPLDPPLLAIGNMQSLFFSRNEYFSILVLTKTHQYCSKPVKDVSPTYDGKVTRHLAPALLAYG